MRDLRMAMCTRGEIKLRGVLIVEHIASVPLLVNYHGRLEII